MDPTILTQYLWCISPAISGQGKRKEKGCAILVKGGIPHSIISKSENHITVKFQNFYAICVYFIPHTDVDKIVGCVLEYISEAASNLPIIICGDFNCRLDFGKRGLELVDSLMRYGFHLENDPTVTTYVTSNGQSTIDLIFHNSDLVKEPRVFNTTLRKHQRIVFQISPITGSTEQLERGPRLKRDVDAAKLVTSLALMPPPNADRNRSIDDIERDLIAVIKRAIPSVGKKKSFHKPWFDMECAAQKRKVLSLKKTYDCTVRKEVEEFVLESRKYKTLLRRKREDFEEERLHQKIEDSECSPWLLFRTRKGNSPSKILPDEWERHFAQLYNPNNEAPNIPPRETLCPAEDLNDPEVWYNAPFSEWEVQAVLRRLPKGKAPGPDSICYEHIVKSLPLLAPLIGWLLNFCFWSMQVPTNWLDSIVKIMYKGKGSRDDPNKYRGIALQNSLFKIFANLLNKRLIGNIDGLLPTQQYGYRRNRSTEQPLRDLIMTIQTALQAKGGHHYVLFIDFTKAFDNVNRELLLEKLKTLYGVRGRLLGSIADTLRGNRLHVTDGFTQTEGILQSKGVQQGDCLSPTLFIAYIGDLPSTLEESGTQGSYYADDTQVGSGDRNQIKSALNLLEDWCNKNKICVNTEKTKIIKFRKGGRLHREDVFTYQGQKIEIVSSYEYLGITLQSRLTFSEQISKVKRKTRCIISCLSNLNLVSVECAAKIFNMKILPVISYCLNTYSAFLSLEHLKDLDKIKAFFFKRALCLHESASSTLTLEMAGTNSLCQQLKNMGFEFEESVWREYCDFRDERILNICIEYGSEGPAFVNTCWRGKRQKNRHCFTRSTVHGFHYKMCKFIDCRKVGEACECILCNNHADIYHLLDCPANNMTLTEFVYFLDML